MKSVVTFQRGLLVLLACLGCVSPNDKPFVPVTGDTAVSSDRDSGEADTVRPGVDGNAPDLRGVAPDLLTAGGDAGSPDGAVAVDGSSDAPTPDAPSQVPTADGPPIDSAPSVQPDAAVTADLAAPDLPSPGVDAAPIDAPPAPLDAGGSQAAQGSVCTANDQCASRYCVDGYCCEGPCTGSCRACKGPGGTCVAVMSAPDPDSCTGNQTCDATGSCKKSSGQDCGLGSECGTGNCVDGKCCTTSSCGACQTCGGPGGACASVTNGADPDSCSGSCDSTGSCKKTPGQQCMNHAECMLGNCVDGVCCDQPCTGSCMSCGGGSCQPVANAPDPDTCPGRCDAAGVCRPQVKALSAGTVHTCALLSSGAVRCWGCGVSGRLGYGNTADRSTPGPDVSLGGLVAQPAGPIPTTMASGNHTCVLLTGGTVRCWGAGNYGQLGSAGTQNIGDSQPPAGYGDVMVGGTVSKVAVGELVSCAVLVGGGLRCWGYGYYGQLGYGNSMNIGDGEFPASAGNVPVTGTVVDVAIGSSHTCALFEGGSVRCWGAAAEGRLGVPNASDLKDASMAGTVAVGGPVKQIVAGGAHTCVLLNAGTVRCWGASLGLGYGNTEVVGDNELPLAAGDVMIGGTAVQIAAGQSHTCALLSNGDVRCWGRANEGQLGYGNKTDIGDNETPASVGPVPVGGKVVHIAAGGFHTCAVLETGAVRCWGDGVCGELGYGNINTIGDNETPASAGDVPVIP